MTYTECSKRSFVLRIVDFCQKPATAELIGFSFFYENHLFCYDVRIAVFIQILHNIIELGQHSNGAIGKK
jgi:hypothetical protein